MGYKGEEITKRLRQARMEQGLSQRALAERSGLTQSHISQIENGATEPGLSSLIDLARALDLDVMLIPHKRFPAVSSLIEVRPSASLSADPLLRKEIERGEDLVDAIELRIGGGASLDRLREALRFFRNLPPQGTDREGLNDVLDMLKRRQDDPHLARRVREAAETLWAIRNRLAHARPTPIRAAYALDDEDHDDG